MFEIVEAIHRALRTESTLVFVLVIAGVFAVGGGVFGWLVDAGYKNSAEYREEHNPPLPHPIIQVSTTSVRYKPDTRQVIVSLTFVNLSSFGVEAKLHLHLMWGGPHFPGGSGILEGTAIDRIIAMGSQPGNFALTTSYILPSEQASQWVEEKALIMVGAAATYADKDAATEYDFAGSIRLKQDFVDVDMSRWFTRPKEAAMF